MALDVLVMSSIAVSSTLRIYIISGRNQLISLGVLILGLINPAITAYTCTQIISPVLGKVPRARCTLRLQYIISQTYVNWTSAAQMSSVAFAIVTVLITWLKLRGWVPRASTNSGPTLHTVLIRDKALYCLPLCQLSHHPHHNRNGLCTFQSFY